jgi:MoxR-like ATPase
MNQVKNQISTEIETLHQIEIELNSMFFEREEAIKLALLSLVTKAHMLWLGPPGTSKSNLIKELSSRFCDSSGKGLKLFDKLMTPFTVDDDLFGPYNMDKYIHEGKKVRVTEGTLCEAQIAFLDEFARGNQVRVALLEVMTDWDVVIFAASNRLENEDELQALYDRFLIKNVVGYVESSDNFKSLLSSRANPVSTTVKTYMDQSSLLALRQQVESVRIPQSIIGAMDTLRSKLKKEKGIVASDRRWVWVLELLKACALYDGLSIVEEDHLAVLSHCLWHSPDQIVEVKRLVSELANPLNAKADELKDMVVSIKNQAASDIQALTGDHVAKASRKLSIQLEAINKISEILVELSELQTRIKQEGKKTQRVDRALATANAIKEEIVRNAI